MKKCLSIMMLAAMLCLCTAAAGPPAYAEADFDSWGLAAPPSEDTQNVILNSKSAPSSEIIPVDTKFTSADGKTLRLTMTGLTSSNKGSMLNALREHFRDSGEGSDTPIRVEEASFIDAEKWNCLEEKPFEYYGGYDTLHCWAASCANMLWLSGWAGSIKNPRTDQPFSSEDDIFAYYNVCFTDRGSDADRAIDWFFMQEYFLSGTSSGAGVTKQDAGGFRKEFVSSLAQTQYDLVERPLDIDKMLRVAADPENRSVFEVSLGSVSSSGLSGSQHAVTGIGLITDPDADDIADKYKAIILIDSDNDGIPTKEERPEWDEIIVRLKAAEPFSDEYFSIMNELISYMEGRKPLRPNSYTVYKLRYSKDVNGTPYWELVGYSDDDATALYDIDELPCPSNKVISGCIEDKGSMDVNADVDLTLDNLFTTSNEESLPDPYLIPDDTKKIEFERGEPVNINYFLANRSNVDLGGEQSDGEDVLVDWIVTRDSDGSTVASGSVSQRFIIFKGIEAGAMLYLNKTASGYEKWQPGAYTATVGFNKDGKVREAYYKNNLDRTVHFTITGEADPEHSDDGPQDSGSPQNGNDPQKGSANTLRTGDEATLTLWMLTAVLAAAALAVMMVLKVEIARKNR